jgi:hypothetical protein
VYESKTEQVLERAAYTTWKKGRGPIERVDNSTGEIMCLVEVPPVYRTVTSQVVKTPATTREIDEPAQYSTIRKRVLKAPETTREVEGPAIYATIKKMAVKTPETTREVEVPAEYRTVKVAKMVEGPKEVRTPTPAEYQTVSRSVKVTDERLEWRSILCETNLTPGVIRQVQTALKNAGHDPGTIDGVLGQNTAAALGAYQRAKGLPTSQHLNAETLRSLGVRVGTQISAK